MIQWLKRLFGSSEESPTDEQSTVQSLRLQLQEKDQQLAQLRDDLERERQQTASQASTSVQTHLDKLFTALSVPVSQLLTQSHLVESEDKPLNVKDVLAVARRMVRSLEDEGLKILGNVGEVTSFDANLHMALSSDTTLSPGQKVVVRFVGVTYQGRVIRKIAVEDADAGSTRD